jgi:hypothetical protein
MFFVVTSFLIVGLAAFAMLTMFMALVPRLVNDDKSVASLCIQWALIFTLVVPASFGAILGPLWMYEAIFDQGMTKDDRVWLILAGCALSLLWFFAALRSAPGRAYLSWRSRVG